MNMAMKPLTIMLLLGVAWVFVGVIAAVTCRSNERCKEAFDAPKSALSLMCCCVVSVAVVTLQLQGEGGR